MHLRQITLHLENSPTREHYPFNLPVLQQTKTIEFPTAVTFLVGENGSGKSTLLEALAHKCRIHIWRDARVTRFETNSWEGRLFQFLEAEWANGSVPGSYFDSEISQHFAQYLDEWAVADPDLLQYFGGKSLVSQSHGQSLMSFFKARYRIKGLYFLDEPETALSPRSQLELLQLFQEMGRAGHAQFIIASHSPILLACPGATLYSFDHIPVKSIDYKETEHYRIYKAFMQDRERFIPQT